MVWQFCYINNIRYRVQLIKLGPEDFCCGLENTIIKSPCLQYAVTYSGCLGDQYIGLDAQTIVQIPLPFLKGESKF